MNLKKVVKGLCGAGVVLGSLGMMSSLSYEIYRTINDPYENQRIVKNYEEAHRTLNFFENIKNSTELDLPYDSQHVRSYLDDIADNKRSLESAIESVRNDIVDMKEDPILKKKEEYDNRTNLFNLLLCTSISLTAISSMIMDRID